MTTMAACKMQRPHLMCLWIVIITQMGILIQGELIVKRHKTADVFEGMKCSPKKGYSIPFGKGCKCDSEKKQDTFYLKVKQTDTCYNFGLLVKITEDDYVKIRKILEKTEDEIPALSTQMLKLKIWNYDKMTRKPNWVPYSIQAVKYWHIKKDHIKLINRESWDGLLVAFYFNGTRKDEILLIKFTGERTYPLPNKIEDILKTGSQKDIEKKEIEKKSNVGIIIGIIISMILIVVVILVLILWKRRKNNHLTTANKAADTKKERNSPENESCLYQGLYDDVRTTEENEAIDSAPGQYEITFHPDTSEKNNESRAKGNSQKVEATLHQDQYENVKTLEEINLKDSEARQYELIDFRTPVVE